MTNPTLTYGHGFLNDMDDAADWTETESSLTCAHSSLYADVLKLEGTPNDSGDEYAYYEQNITDISSSTYTKYMVRWRTSESSNGLGARVKLVFTSGTQWILGEDAPEFSTTWQVETGDITTGKTVDKVQLWADDYPDSTDSGTDQVYFDFVLLHKNTFTFPFVAGNVELDMLNLHAKIPGLSRVGSHTQYMGMQDPIIRLNGEMDSNTDWGSPDGEYLYYIWSHAHEDTFQWFTSDLINCKVIPNRFTIAQDSQIEALNRWSAELSMYNASSGSENRWKTDLEWLGL